MDALTPRIREKHITAYVLDDGQYVQAESFESYYSMAWSTEAPASILTSISYEVGFQNLSKHDTDGVVLLIGMHQHQVSDASHVIDVCGAKPEDVLFARIDYAPRLSLSWRAGRNTRSGPSELSQFAFMANVHDPNFVEYAMYLTGTPAIAENSHQLSREVKPIEIGVPLLRGDADELS